MRIRVLVEIDLRDKARVLVGVEDDGRGPGDGVRPNLGLLGMRERVTALGGALETGPAGASGFRVEAVIPMGAGA